MPLIDPDEPTEKREPLIDPDEPPEPSSLLRRGVGDPLISAAKGTLVGIPETIVGLTDIPTLGLAGKAVDAVAKATVGGGFKEANAAFDKMLSPETQAAKQELAETKGFVPSVMKALENPSTILNAIAESAPSMASGAALGRAVMKGIGLGVGAKGITEAQKVGRAITAGAVGEGAVTVGQNTEQLRQEMESGTLTPVQALLMSGSGFATGLISRMSGGLAKRLGITDVDALLQGVDTGAKRTGVLGVLRSLAESAITEGALEELPQSAQEQMALNIASGKPPMEGVAEAAAMGLLAGAGMGMMGAGGGVVMRAIAKDPLHAEIENQIDPEGKALIEPPSVEPPLTFADVDMEDKGPFGRGTEPIIPPGAIPQFAEGEIGSQVEGAGGGPGFGVGMEEGARPPTGDQGLVGAEGIEGTDTGVGGFAPGREKIEPPTNDRGLVGAEGVEGAGGGEGFGLGREEEGRPPTGDRGLVGAEPLTNTGGGEGFGVGAEEGAKPAEVKPPEKPPEPPGPPPPEPGKPPGPTKRSWYVFKDLDPNEWTPEEEERMMDGKGPTPEETAAWKAQQSGEAGAKAQAERDKAAAAAETRRTDIINRASRKMAENYPDLSLPETAKRIASLAGGIGQERIMKPSEYSARMSQAMGIPEKYAYLSKILDRLGVQVTVSNQKASGASADYMASIHHPSGKGMVRIHYNGIARQSPWGKGGYGPAYAEETMVHEYLHAIVRESGAWKSAEPKLKAFWYELLKHKASAPKSINYYFEHIEKQEIDEMVSMAFSEPRFAQWLDSIPAEGVRNPSKTLWGKLKDIIMRAIESFGVPKSKLDELNELLDKIIATAHMEAGITDEGEGKTLTPEEKPPAPPKSNAPVHATFGPLDNPNTVSLSKSFAQRIPGAGLVNKNIVKDWIAREYQITTTQLAAFEKDGTYNHKAVEEAFEYAIIQLGRRMIMNREGLKAFVDLYNKQVNLSQRTSTSTILQQYSTPLPIAYMMNRYLGLNPGNDLTVYEPTAGNGMLLIGATPMNVTANELDTGARLNNLKDFVPAGTVTSNDALANPEAPAPKSQDRVIANPPFGSRPVRDVEKYQLTKVEHQIMAEALYAMKDDGKAAFIIGGHNNRTEARTPTGELVASREGMSGPDRIFLTYLYNTYNVTHNIEVDGALYSRQGTKYPVRLITLEGRKATQTTGIPEFTGIEPANTFEDIAKILERKVTSETGTERPTDGRGGRAAGEGRGGEGAGETGGGRPERPSGDTGGGPGTTVVEPKGGIDERPAGEGNGEPGGIQPGEGGAVGGGTVRPEDRSGEEKPTGASGEDTGRADTGRAGPGNLTDKEQAQKDLEDAMKDLDLMPTGPVTPIQKMPFESEKEEANYAKLKPAIETLVTTTINEKGGEDVSMVDIISDIRDYFKDKFDKLKKYVSRYLKEELVDLKARIRDAVMFQVPYVPKSKGSSDGTMASRNQADSMQQALAKLEADHGNLDEWVAQELQYDSTQALWDAVGAEQVDALAAGIDAFQKNGGFILGDQTGVGKGRVVAGLMWYAKLQGKIPIFVTAKADLFSDMARDLRGIGHPLKPFIMNGSKESDIYNKDTNELLLDAQSVEAKGPAVGGLKPRMKGGQPVLGKNGQQAMQSFMDWDQIVQDPLKYMNDNGFETIFTTYSQHNNPGTKQQDRVIGFLGADNYFMLDEAHKAAGDSSGGTSNTKEKFSVQLKAARAVLYSSATYAKTAHNMSIYFRTAIGDTGIAMHELIDAIIAGKNPLQEYISSILTKMGQMLRRELSWEGITWQFSETMHNTGEKVGSARYQELKDQYETDKHHADSNNAIVKPLVKFSAELHSNTPHKKAALVALLRSKGIADVGPGGARMNPSNSTFGSVVHNFSSQLLASIKTDRAIADAKRAIDEGRKPIINIMNTMGSFLQQVVKAEGLVEGDQIGFTYKAVLEKAMNNTFLMKGRDAYGRPFQIKLTPEEVAQNLPWAYTPYQVAKMLLDRYDGTLHASPIDYIKYELEQYTGKPVSEITGRSLMINYNDPSGEKTLGMRKDTNRAEAIFNFNSGLSDVLIFNAAGAEGISLHATTKGDPKPRRMIFLQPNHDVNVHMQSAGRIFRKGQIAKPEYTYVQTDLPAEVRPSVMLQRKLASLKANTTSKQAGSETRTDIPDMMNEYGNRIVREYLDTHKVLAVEIGVIHSITDDIPEVTYQEVSGKITILPVETQREFYGEIEVNYFSLIDELNEKGENNLISKNYDFRAVSQRGSVIFQGPDPDNPFTGNAVSEMMTVRVLRKPHNTAKIQSLVKENLGLVTVGEMNEEIAEKISDFFDSGQKDYQGAELSRRAGAVRTADQYNDSLEKRAKKATDAYFSFWMDKLPEKHPDADPAKLVQYREIKLKALYHEFTVMREALHKFKIGDTYTVPPVMYTVGQQRLPDLTGVLTKILWKEAGEGVNPIQPSALKFVFSVSDPIQTRIYTSGQSWFTDDSNHIQAGIPEDWDQILPSNKTEEKVIITGNLIRGINKIQSESPPITAEMVYFTRDDGRKEFGLMVARIDQDRAMNLTGTLQGRMVDWQGAYDHLSDRTAVQERFASSENGEITFDTSLSKDDQGNTVIAFQVGTYRIQRIGAKYYQDPDLMKLVRGGNWRGYGAGRMVANIDPANLKAFMKALHDKFGMRFVLPLTQAATIQPVDKNSPLNKFYIFYLSPRGFEEVKGKEVTLTGFEWIKAFAFKDPDGKMWRIYERRSGQALGSAWNKESDAKSSAINTLQRSGLTRQDLEIRFNEQIAANDGGSPYHQESKKLQGMPVQPRLVQPHEDYKVQAERLGIVYNGAQEWLQRPGQPYRAPVQMFTDTITGSTFGLQEGEDLAANLAAIRAKYPEGFKYQPMPSIQEFTDKFINRPQDAFGKEVQAIVRPYLQTQNDFQQKDKYFGLPWWNAKKYPAWRKAFEIFGIDRPENRGKFMHSFAQKAEPFFKLEENMRKAGKTAAQIAAAKDRINRALITGDAVLGQELKDLKRKVKTMEDGFEKTKVKRRIWQIETLNRYSDQELLNGIKDDRGKVLKLSQEEIDVYRNVRESLDFMFYTYMDHLQTQAFRTYRKQKWYAILMQAAGMDLNKSTTLRILGSGLDQAALLRAVRIQVDVQKIFDRVENGILVTPEGEKIAAGELYGYLADKMSEEISNLEKALRELTGEKDLKKITDMARALLSAYMFTRPQLKLIKRLRNTYKKQIAFFPRVREQGPHKLKVMQTIYNKEGLPIREHQVFMKMFSSERDVQDIKKEIMERFGKNGALPKDYKIVPEQSTQTPEFAFQGVNDINMQKVLDDAIDGMKIRDTYVNAKGEKVDIHERLRQMGYEALAKQFQSRGFGRHMVHRQWNVVKGYEEGNLDRILFNYMTGMSGIMTKQVAAADFLEMMKEVDTPQMFASLQKYGRDQLRNETAADRFSNKARSFMFTWYLGGVLRPAIIQLTQNFVTGIPKHAQYLRDNGLGGFGKADKDYIKSMADVATKNLTPLEQRMQEQLFIEGVTVDQYIREIFGSLGTKFDQSKMRVLHWLAVPFSSMEMYNRKSAALTRFRPAYQLALKEGLNEEAAYEKAFESARDYVYDTHYAMGKANLPQLAQGEGVGTAIKTLYTFKSFTHNFVLSTYNDLAIGDWKTVMHSMAYLALFGGLMGLPFFKDLFEWIEKEFGFSFTKSVRQTLRATGGKSLETFGMNGLPALLGANFSGSLAIGVPFMGEDTLSTIGGVYEGQLQKLQRAGEAAMRGDTGRTIENLSPEFLRGPLTAARESAIGSELFGTPGFATTPGGAPQLDETGKPISMGVGQALVKAAGGSPTGNARAKEVNQSMKRLESWVSEQKSLVGERYRTARLKKDPNALRDLMREVRDINGSIRARGLEKLVPLATVPKIVQSSRQVMTTQKRRENRYRAEQ